MALAGNARANEARLWGLIAPARAECADAPPSPLNQFIIFDSYTYNSGSFR